jgi:quercetin dioxygenase-like cupin family protein
VVPARTRQQGGGARGEISVRKVIAVAALAAAALLPWAVEAKGGGKGVAIPAGDLKWKDAGPDSPGVQMATVAGDPTKGAGKFFVKLPPGFSVPLHHHTADHSGVVVSGTLVQNIDGQDFSLTPGSYLAYTGKKQHTTKCTDPAGCIVFVDTHGKWDVVPEKTAAK